MKTKYVRLFEIIAQSTLADYDKNKQLQKVFSLINDCNIEVSRDTKSNKEIIYLVKKSDADFLVNYINLSIKPPRKMKTVNKEGTEYVPIGEIIRKTSLVHYTRAVQHKYVFEIARKNNLDIQKIYGRFFIKESDSKCLLNELNKLNKSNK